MSDKSLTIILPADIYEKLKKLSVARERSMGAEVRMALQAHLRDAERSKK